MNFTNRCTQSCRGERTSTQLTPLHVCSGAAAVCRVDLGILQALVMCMHTEPLAVHFTTAPSGIPIVHPRTVLLLLRRKTHPPKRPASRPASPGTSSTSRMTATLIRRRGSICTLLLFFSNFVLVVLLLVLRRCLSTHRSTHPKRPEARKPRHLGHFHIRHFEHPSAILR